MALDLWKAPQLEKRSRVHEVTFRREYLEAHQPVVIAGATAAWMAHARWSPAYLRARFGEVRLTANGRATSLTDLFEAIESGLSPQIWGLPLAAIDPELLQDVAPPLGYEGADWLDHRLIPNRILRAVDRAPLVEVGGCGGTSPLRVEPFGAHCFLTQLIGGQRIALVAPEQEETLYPREDGDLPLRSQFDQLGEADLRLHPLVEEADPMTTELEAGETLFIPSGWWHQGQTTSEFSVAVATRVVNGSNFAEFLDELWNHERSLSAGVASVLLRAYGWWRGREEASRAELLAAVR